MIAFIRFKWRLCLRTVTTSCSNQRLRYLSSFTFQDFSHETTEETGALITRFAKHIAVESYKFDPLVPRTINYSDYFPVHDICTFRNEVQKISTDQLPALIIFTFTYRCNGDPMKFVQVLNDIDVMCMKRLPKMDNVILLRIMYSLLFLIPRNITKTQFYKSAISRLIQTLESSFSKEKFVQVCFYVGLMKNNAPSELKDLFLNFVHKYLDSYTVHLSILDLAIVSSAIYKTSICIESPIYMNRIQKELLLLPLDDALLVTFVKNLRLQRVTSEKVCERLKNFCESPALQLLKITGLTHIFAYFAENRWDDLITKKIVTEFIERFNINKFKSNEVNIRAKDICMFLWCCSQLNIRLSILERNSLEAIILNKVGNGEFRNFSDQLVDCGLNLWILGVKSRAIVQEVIKIKGKYFSFAKHRQVHSKIDNRFIILQSAVAIEYPLWLPSVKGFDEDFVTPTHLLKTCVTLKQYTQQLNSEQGIASAKIVYPIRGINIPNIRVKFLENDEQIFLEVLEEEHLLKFSQKPVALLRLKQTLLEALGHEVINIRFQDLHEHYTCLKDIILKGLKDRRINDKLQPTCNMFLWKNGLSEYLWTMVVYLGILPRAWIWHWNLVLIPFHIICTMTKITQNLSPTWLNKEVLALRKI